MSIEGSALRPDLRCPRCGAVNPQAQRFCGDCGAELQKAAADAERRYLTVMFCDLVGSTALSEQLDPEELGEVILAYREVVAAVVARYGGYVARYVGDGVLVYFGYPKAHGDDPTRAVYAGVHILEGIERLCAEPQMRVKLRVRIGVHTGLVVVGDLARGAVREEAGVLGETPNLAARVMGLAPENALCVTGVTQSLIVDRFDCTSLGLVEIAGLSRPVSVFRVVAPRAPAGGDLSESGPITKLVNRKWELEALRDAWERTLQSQGQVIAIAGEPGIGKTRLIRAFADSLEDTSHQRIVLRCSPYFSNSALHPVTEFLNRRLDASGAGDKLAQLAQIVADVRMPPDELVPMLAALLSLPLEDYRPAEASAARQRGMIMDFLSAWLTATARRQPTLIVIEDLQWADASTLELAVRLQKEVGRLAVLMLFAYRTGSSLPAGMDAPVVQLDRLTNEDAHELIERVAAGRPLPAHVVDALARRTDGVPLFVEELTKAVMESPRPAESPGGAEPAWDIPISLHATLMARLDSLDSAKAVAQRASVLGREFSYELIAAASRIPKAELDRGLAQLVDAELLFETGSPPRAVYVFKHSMIQETAYRSLLRVQRRAFHAEIGSALESAFPGLVGIHPEVAAHHFAAAQEPVRAAPYWRKAGEQALARSANIEACAHIHRGIADLQSCEESPERIKEEALLQIALGSALSALKGSAAPEVEQTYARAEEMCRKLDDPKHLFPALRGLQSFYLVHGPLRTARRMVEQLMQMADAGGDELQLVEARRRLGWCLFCMGKIEQGRESLVWAVERYDRARSGQHIVTYGSDPGVIGLVNLAWLEWFAGRADSAVAYSHKAILLSRELSYKLGMAYALGMSAALYQCLDQPSITRALAEETLEIARRHDFPYWSAWQSALLGWSHSRTGDFATAIDLLEQGIAGYRATGAELFGSHMVGMLAQVCLQAGRFGRSLELCDEALASSNRTDAHFYDAEIHRIEGDCILQRDGNVVGAIACFEEARALAREQGAHMLELRSSISMAEALASAGRAGEARTLAAEAHDRLDGSVAVADRDRARRVLERT